MRPGLMTRSAATSPAPLEQSPREISHRAEAGRHTAAMGASRTNKSLRQAEHPYSRAMAWARYLRRSSDGAFAMGTS
jgi:hypothetical protein